MAASLRYVPPVFGLWQAHAHCVKRTYVVFMAFWDALYDRTLMDPSTPVDNIKVFSHPKLIRLEHLVTALFLCETTPETRRMLDSLRHHTARMTDTSARLWQQISNTLFSPLLSTSLHCLLWGTMSDLCTGNRRKWTRLTLEEDFLHSV